MDTAISTPIRLSTADLPSGDRLDWLRVVIGREYVKVEVGPPKAEALFNEMTIRPWESLRLSAIRSNAITIERLPGEPYEASQDTYFAVLLMSGTYTLQQQGREVTLRPGDLALYDATRPHRIHCPGPFAKFIVTVPRSLLRDRITGVEHCTALRIPGDQGMGAVAADFLRSAVAQACHMQPSAFRALSAPAVDLLSLALASVRPEALPLSRSRSASLHRVKDFIERRLADPELGTAAVACGVGLSPRYINALFRSEDTSLMRHVRQRRLERCRRDLLDPAMAGRHLSEIAFRWGFNDLSHFSRAFKQQFGCAPKDYRRSAES